MDPQIPFSFPQSWGDLLQLRLSLSPTDYLQQVLAPQEHAAYAREAVSQNPFMALSLASAIPFYSLAKQTGAVNAWTPASVDEMFAGYGGIGAGLKDWYSQQSIIDNLLHKANLSDLQMKIQNLQSQGLVLQ